jgi:hypothetical protein
VKKLLLAAAAALCLFGSADAQTYGGPSLSAQINTASITTIKVLANNAARQVNITELNVDAAGSTTVTLEYGTKTTNECDTGTVVLAGPWSLTASGPNIITGDGMGTIWTVPAGEDVCVVNSAAIQIGGSISYNYFQFLN